MLDDDPALRQNDLGDSERCEIVKKGPVQLQIDFPKNSEGQRFTISNYYMFMKSGEEINKSWLIYSKAMDSVFCAFVAGCLGMEAGPHS